MQLINPIHLSPELNAPLNSIAFDGLSVAVILVLLTGFLSLRVK